MNLKAEDKDNLKLKFEEQIKELQKKCEDLTTDARIKTNEFEELVLAHQAEIEKMKEEY